MQKSFDFEHTLSEGAVLYCRAWYDDDPRKAEGLGVFLTEEDRDDGEKDVYFDLLDRGDMNTCKKCGMSDRAKNTLLDDVEEALYEAALDEVAYEIDGRVS